MSRVLPRPDEVLVAAVAPDARLVGRAIHPWAWWLWAIGAAVAVSLARNPLLLILLIAAVVFVVLQRRSQASWARSLGLYFALAGIVIAVRVLFQIVLGGLREGTVLFTLPEIDLPRWAAGIRLGGPVTLEGLLYTIFDAGRLAGLLICIGAANTLANPKRTLRNVPAAFHQVATALVIAAANFLLVAGQMGQNFGMRPWESALKIGPSYAWLLLTLALDRVDYLLWAVALLVALGAGLSGRRPAPSAR